MTEREKSRIDMHGLVNMKGKGVGCALEERKWKCVLRNGCGGRNRKQRTNCGWNAVPLRNSGRKGVSERKERASKEAFVAESAQERILRSGKKGERIPKKRRKKRKLLGSKEFEK